MFVAKKLRHAITDTLDAAALSIAVAGVPQAVTVLRAPPSGGWVSDAQLPAVYLYVRRETISPQARGIDDRSFQVDMILQAKGSGDDVLDQLDDLQLALEIAIAGSGNLGGLVTEIRPQESEIHIERGSVVFGARRLSFAARVGVTRRDPTLT